MPVIAVYALASLYTSSFDLTRAAATQLIAKKKHCEYWILGGKTGVFSTFLMGITQDPYVKLLGSKIIASRNGGRCMSLPWFDESVFAVFYPRKLT